jgi:hypothetical protein
MPSNGQHKRWHVWHRSDRGLELACKVTSKKQAELVVDMRNEAATAGSVWYLTGPFHGEVING